MAGCVLAAAPGLWSTTAADTRPNVLIILTDDQGFGDVSAHGHPFVSTPHIDRLLATGVELRDMHATPVCSPTRASLLTGRQFLRTGVWGVHGGRDYLALGETTLAERFRQAGYATAMAGKWHVGKTAPYMPWRRGFDEGWALVDERLYAHTDPVFEFNGRELRPKGWTAEILTDLAIEWITRPRAQPFFYFLSHVYIHEPYYAPPERIAPFLERGLGESMATLCAMIEHLDTEVGRLLMALQAAGQLENTIVWFMGDNGPIGNPVNLPHLTAEEMDARNPAGLRGVKGNVYEGGMRVPAAVRWPSRLASRVELAEFDVTDVAPTLLGLAGIEASPIAFDGVNRAPLLTGCATGESATDLPARYYANHEANWPGRTRLYDFMSPEVRRQLRYDDQLLAVRVGPFKLVRTFGELELFDLSNDPGEQTNLASLDPQRTAALDARLRAWWEHDVWATPQSYQMPRFTLPVKTGERVELFTCAPTWTHGGVVQGSHNSGSWSREGDGIGYALSVPVAGRYCVSITARPGMPRGSVVIRAGGQRLEAPITPARIIAFEPLQLVAGEVKVEVRLGRIQSDTGPVWDSVESIGIERLDSPRAHAEATPARR